MNETAQKNNDFLSIYNRAYRLVAAVFMVSNLMDQNEELRTKIKKLSLELVSVSVNLKDTNFLEARKLIGDLEKISLELMSMLDISSVVGLISKMNGDIIKSEFQSFISELGVFVAKFEERKQTSVKGILTQSSNYNLADDFYLNLPKLNSVQNVKSNNLAHKNGDNGNGHKRKDLRKSTILEFIKGHKNVGIKDIVPNIVGCSEKTVQRELTALIEEGRIVKLGERRWSRYSSI